MRQYHRERAKNNQTSCLSLLKCFSQFPCWATRLGGKWCGCESRQVLPVGKLSTRLVYTAAKPRRTCCLNNYQTSPLSDETRWKTAIVVQGHFCATPSLFSWHLFSVRVSPAPMPRCLSSSLFVLRLLWFSRHRSGSPDVFIEPQDLPLMLSSPNLRAVGFTLASRM